MKNISKLSQFAAMSIMASSLATNPRVKGLGKRSQVVGRSDILPSEVPRNALCPCGSGLKHKKCCMGKE